MPLQAQQIVALACQDAKCPGFTSQGGQFLNAALQDYCQNYDLEAALGTNNFSFNSVTGQGSGPYTLPVDYLRTRVQDGKDEFFYTINGVPYPLIQCTLTEFDWMVQTPGFQNFPYYYATDLTTSPPTMKVWPPASGSFPCVQRYFRLMPDIVTPETSATIPWFTNTMILQRDVAGRLMGLTGDDRQAAYLGDDDEHYPLGVGTLMRKYLKNVEDREGAVHTVGRDRRRWGRSFDLLKNTKTVGWLLPFLIACCFYFASPEQSHANCATPCTKAQITTDINTNWPDNTTQQITPALLRSTVLDLVNSYLDVNGASSFTCPTHQFLTAIATLSSYSCAALQASDIPNPIAGGSAANSSLIVESTSSGAPSGDFLNLSGSTVIIGPIPNVPGTISLAGPNGGGTTINFGSAGNGLSAFNVFTGGGSKQTWVSGGGNTTITFPGATDQLVGRATTDTLTNKTISSTNNTLTNVVTSLTPGAGNVSSVTAACSQTAITATGTLSEARCVDARTTTTETINDSDRHQLITASNAGAQAYSIAQAGAASAFQSGWDTCLYNKSTNVAGIVTITATTSTFSSSGTTSLKIQPGQTACLESDGANYNVYAAPTVNQVPGTATNDAANIGNLGEYVESVIASGSATALTTATAKTITSISLTAGDWDVGGNISYNGAGGASVTFLEQSLSTTTNTVDQTAGRNSQESMNATVPGTSPGWSQPVGPHRFSLSATTTIFLVSNQTFTVGTLNGWGILRARRMR